MSNLLAFAYARCQFGQRLGQRPVPWVYFSEEKGRENRARALTPEQVNAAWRHAAIDPAKWTVVLADDQAKIQPSIAP